MSKKLVVLSGAGMSAESGIRTFRDKDGWWQNHNPMELASPEAFESDPQLVLGFYNYRRKKVMEAEPNEGHKGLVTLEQDFDVQIVTQNVDDLHERAGSKNVLHLHGEIRKARSTVDENLIYNIQGWELKLGDKCDKGSQLRPHVVWFGEPVNAILDAASICEKADIFVVVGTSLNVYPAAGLIDYVPNNTPIFLIDPHDVNSMYSSQITYIKEKATTGVPLLVEQLKEK